MKYYKGVVAGKDEPFNGGSYVDENGEGHEQYNFDPVNFEDGEFCLGFFETKSNRGKRNQFHIENIQGCEAYKDEESIDDVLVVWCATTMLNETSIVGWYKHATVFRHYQEAEFETGYIQSYNILAESKDCVLLPEADRHMFKWNAPVAKKKTYGFGQSMVWYCDEDNAQDYINCIAKQINEYDGENWLNKYPD